VSILVIFFQSSGDTGKQPLPVVAGSREPFFQRQKRSTKKIKLNLKLYRY
jgi:hypothetical protein